MLRNAKRANPNPKRTNDASVPDDDGWHGDDVPF